MDKCKCLIMKIFFLRILYSVPICSKTFFLFFFEILYNLWLNFDNIFLYNFIGIYKCNFSISINFYYLYEIQLSVIIFLLTNLTLIAKLIKF